VDGERRCPRCKKPFAAHLFDPVVDPGPMVIPVSAQGESTPCARHARNAAESSCHRCGAFMCALCRIDSDDLSLCPGCFERLSAEGALPSARTTYKDYGRMSVHAFYLCILFWPLSIIAGPIAVWYGIVGLRASRQPGVNISRARCWVGIVFGALALLGSIGLILVLVIFNRQTLLPR
jgi:hypothetical protein